MALVYMRQPTMGFGLSAATQQAIVDAAKKNGIGPAPPPQSIGQKVAAAVAEHGIGPTPTKPGGFVGNVLNAAEQAKARLPPAPTPAPPRLTLDQGTKGAIVDHSGRVSVPSSSAVPANPATPSLPTCSASSVWDPVSRSCKAKPLPACAAGMVRNADGLCARPSTSLPPQQPNHPAPETTPSGPGTPATDGGTAGGTTPIVTGSGPGTGGGGGGGSALPVGPSQPPADSVGGGGSVTYDASGAATTPEPSALPFGLTPTKIAIGAGVALAGWYLLKHGGKKGR